MSDNPKDKFRKTIDGLNLNLDGLLGSLGDALGEAMARLEQGQTGASDTTQTVQTPKGPLRATSAVRVRVGGLAAETPTSRPQPVNPHPRASAPAQPAPPPASSQAKVLACEVLEDADCWIVTAEMPGVALAEVALARDQGMIALTTTGTRRYSARIAPPCPCGLDQIVLTMNNGILTMQFPKDATG